jgi:hypothetical protein
MMTYQERLRTHLVKYKFRVLGVLANAAWKGPRTGAVAEQPHILPAADARLNILAPYRSRFWQEFDRGEGRSLHRDFAHLSSSQAMCFNLFYPLTVDREWAAAFFQGVLDVKDAPRTLAFEYVEEPGEATRFDFVAALASGARVHFETRLAELGFGTVDLPPRERFNLLSRHTPRLSGLVEAKWLEPDVFFRRYQLFRALACLERPASSLYLVVPRANESLQQALAILPEITAGALEKRVRVLYLEDALERMKPLLRGRDEALKQHYREFRDKYLPAE